MPPSPYSIRVETKLGELNVAARDLNGHAIHGLKREEFRIYDEGQERDFAAFSEESTAWGTYELRNNSRRSRAMRPDRLRFAVTA